MINYKRLFIFVLLFFIIMSSNIIFATTGSAEEVNVDINENQVTVSGKLNEANTDVTIIAYRSSDNSRIYIDQGKTNGSGNFSFSFTLPNGTYFAVINFDGTQYRTETIVAYKAGEEPQPEQIYVVVDENNVTITGKTNENKGDVTLVVYRESDNSKVYVDQVRTEVNGNFSFSFALPNGTYIAVITADGTQYRTEKFLVYKTGEEPQPEQINVDVNENNVTMSGKINENNEDVTLIVYRENDSSKVYIDQGKTDGSGNFSFSFALPNGTYFAVINAEGTQYITEKFVVYKAVEEPEPDVNVVIDKNNVTIIGEINENNEDVTLIVYREDDNSKTYVDQGKTDSSGNFSFSFVLPNGTYFAVISTENKQYIADAFTVEYTAPIISAEISPKSETFDKKTSKQRDITTYIIWNDAEQVVDVKNVTSIGANNYILDNYKLTIKKEYLAAQQKGNLTLSIEFDKGLSAIFTINIVDTTSSGGGSGGGTKPDPTPTPEPQPPIVLPTDIDGHWAKEYITELIKNGIVSNYPDNTFRPDQNITRAEFVTLIVKTLGLESKELNDFDDTMSHWAKDYISAAIENNIIIGYGNNLFGPDDLITREQMAIIVSKAMKLNAVSEMSFEDKDQISEWALNYVGSAAREKIIKGYPDNTFQPKNYLTRAEAATIIYNITQ